MERWLNTRGALVAAWTFAGIVALSAAAFALYLLIPAGGGGAGSEVLPSVTVAAVTATPPPTGRTAFRGTVERVEGQALVVTDDNRQPRRVVLRRDARVGRLTTSFNLSDLKSGDSVVVGVQRQDGGRLVGIWVRVQPPDLLVLTRSGDPRTPNAGIGQYVSGVLESVDDGQLRLRSTGGGGIVDVTISARLSVTRFVPVSLTEVRQGDRVVVDGEHLIDGSIAALSVQVLEAR